MTGDSAASSSSAGSRGVATFDRVVVCVDEAEESEGTVAVASALAQRLGSQILVIHVLETPSALALGFAGSVPGAPSPLISDEIRKSAEQSLGEAVKLFVDMVITAEGRLIDQNGSVGQSIVNTASDWKADLVIMGTRGPTGLEGALLGSTAHEVLHLASCPVLVVPAGS